jgi:hypothetical protein
MEENNKVTRYSEIEFQFQQPLTAEQEDIFIAYFKNIKHSVMDRLSNVIHGTDRNPIKAMLAKTLAPYSTAIMMKYEYIYNRLQLQTMNPGDLDIFVVDDSRKDQNIWSFKMDMAEFDVVTLAMIQAVPNKKIQSMVRQSFNLLSGKDRRIRLDFQRSVLPMMKLRNDQCRIMTRFYDENFPAAEMKEGEEV